MVIVAELMIVTVAVMWLAIAILMIRRLRIVMQVTLVLPATMRPHS